MDKQSIDFRIRCWSSSGHLEVSKSRYWYVAVSRLYNSDHSFSRSSRLFELTGNRCQLLVGLHYSTCISATASSTF